MHGLQAMHNTQQHGQHRNCWKALEAGQHQDKAPKPLQGAGAGAMGMGHTGTVGRRWRLASTRARHRNYWDALKAGQHQGTAPELLACVEGGAPPGQGYETTARL